jgi:nitroreductase
MTGKRTHPPTGTARPGTAPALDAEQFYTAVTAATLAPSMHNTQPWRYRLTDGCLDVSGDPERQLPVADPHGWGVQLACGAAVANAVLALAAAGVVTGVDLLPEPERPTLLARVRPTGTRPATPDEWELARAIPRRHSNRHPFASTPVPALARTALRTAAAAHGAWLELLVGRQPVALVAEIIAAADRQLRQDPAYVAELRRYAAPGHGDGIPEYVAGLAPQPEDPLPLRDFGGRERGRFVDYEELPLVAVLGTTGDTVHDHLVAGIALQHVLLTATVHGLATSMLSQAIEVPAARAQLRSGLGSSGVPQLVLRLGYGQPAFASPRRPLAEVIDGHVADLLRDRLADES